MMRGKKRDPRLPALALVVGLVIAGGMLIAYWPTLFGARAVDDSAQARAAHAREMTEAEISQRFEQGVAMLNAYDYDGALKAFHRVLELSPDMPEAHINAGFALLGLKRYAVARDFFKGALALRKDQVNAYYGLAVAASGMNDLPEAIEAMRIYLHLSPPDDPHRPKALAAVEAWQAQLSRGDATHQPAK
jgi:tetratricopeptide (TPR) repeat protein